MSSSNETQTLVEALQSEASRFLRNEGSKVQISVPFRPTLRQWRLISEAGWFRLILPENHDGLGLGLQHLGVVFYEVGRHLFSLPLIDHAVGLPLVYMKASAHHRKVLRPILHGSGKVAIIDACMGFHARGHKAIEFKFNRLEGQLTTGPGGNLADQFIVFACDESVPWIGLFHRGHPGVNVLPLRSADPTGDYANITFRGAKVRASDMVIEPGLEAAELIDRFRGVSRLMIAHEIGGISNSLFHKSLQHSKERWQFGKPIGSFQAIQHKLADMFVQVDSLRNLCTATAQDLDGELIDLSIPTLAAKAYASEVGRSVSEEALQIHGGIGFTIEHSLHLFLKRALSLQGLYGDERQLQRELGFLLLRDKVRSLTA